MNLEICVDSVESAIAAEQGGATRVELCSALSEGGLTPSIGLIRAVRSRVKIGLYVMIRPRGGDFFYSDLERKVMADDITQAAASGADGVVFGILTADANVDVNYTRELVKLARPMEVTFHRAIDMAAHLEDALEDVIAAGADRILTSGGAQDALTGSRKLHSLVEIAGRRIHVMVGGGVRAANVQKIAETTGASEFHSGLRTATSSPVTFQKHDMHLGDPNVPEYNRYVVRAEDVLEMKLAMEFVNTSGPLA